MSSNPAVTIGLTAGGRFPIGQALPYIVAQVLGAICAAYLLFAIASGAPGFDLSQGFAANGFGDHSPGKYTLFSGFLSEVILTMMFLFIIMGATHGKAPVGFAPIAIGLGLTLVHLIGIPVTNLSVNPREAPGRLLWSAAGLSSNYGSFGLAPILGGIAGGLLYRFVVDEPAAEIVGFDERRIEAVPSLTSITAAAMGTERRGGQSSQPLW